MSGLPFRPVCFLLFILLSVVSCRKPIDIGKETEKLLETDRAFAALSVKEGTPRAFQEYFTDEALQFTGTGNIIRGNQGIYEYMNAALDSTFVLDWEPEEALVSISGDLGYTWGNYITYQRKTATTMDSIASGKYVNIWQKQPDGAWKVLLDIGNSNQNK